MIERIKVATEEMRRRCGGGEGELVRFALVCIADFDGDLGLITCITLEGPTLMLIDGSAEGYGVEELMLDPCTPEEIETWWAEFVGKEVK